MSDIHQWNIQIGEEEEPSIIPIIIAGALGLGIIGYVIYREKRK